MADTDELRARVLRQMAALRRTIDPKLLNRAKLAVFGKVPYDQDVAKQAVASFLDSRDDGGAFRAKLEAALREEGATLDLDAAPSQGGADPEPKAGAQALRPRRIGRLV